MTNKADTLLDEVMPAGVSHKKETPADRLLDDVMGTSKSSTTSTGSGTFAQAINAAEMRNEPDHWIRTKYSKPNAQGLYSSAYGPYQVTRNLARDYRTNPKYKDMWTPEEREFLQRFDEQGTKMLNMSTVNPSHPVYGFGGTGDLTSEADKAMYEQVVQKMLQEHEDSAGGDIDKAIQRWRGASEAEDPEYYRIVRENMKVSGASRADALANEIFADTPMQQEANEYFQDKFKVSQEIDPEVWNNGGQQKATEENNYTPKGFFQTDIGKAAQLAGGGAITPYAKMLNKAGEVLGPAGKPLRVAGQSIENAHRSGMRNIATLPTKIYRAGQSNKHAPKEERLQELTSQYQKTHEAFNLLQKPHELDQELSVVELGDDYNTQEQIKEVLGTFDIDEKILVKDLTPEQKSDIGLWLDAQRSMILGKSEEVDKGRGYLNSLRTAETNAAADLNLGAMDTERFEGKGLGSKAGNLLFADLPAGAVSIGHNMAASAVSGPVGLAYMFGNSAGGMIEDMENQGVDTHTALKYALPAAIGVAALEKAGLDGMTSKGLSTFAGKKIASKGGQALVGALSEGVTEFVQTYPEETAALWAKVEQEGGSEEEMFERFADEFWNMTKQAGYSGLIGSMLGGGTGAMNGQSQKQQEYVQKAAAQSNEAKQILEENADILTEEEKVQLTSIADESTTDQRATDQRRADLDKVLKKMGVKVPPHIVKDKADEFSQGERMVNEANVFEEGNEPSNKSTKKGALDPKQEVEQDHDAAVHQFSSDIRQEVFKELGGSGFSQEWQQLIGSKTRDKKGELIGRSEKVQQTLEKIAHSWNEEADTGIPDAITTEFKKGSEWSADDIASIIQRGESQKASKQTQEQMQGKNEEELSTEDVDAMMKNEEKGYPDDWDDVPFFNVDEFTKRDKPEMPDAATLPVFDGPELLDLTKEITGTNPILKNRVGNKDTIRGQYHSGGNIEIRKDLHTDSEQANKTIAHELGHADDWETTENIGKGKDVVRRIAAIKGSKGEFIAGWLGGEKPLTYGDKKALRKAAKEELSQGEIRRVEKIIKETVPVDPKDILKILNTGTDDYRVKQPDLYNYIAGLNSQKKKEIAIGAMRGMVDEDIQKLGKVIEKKIVTEEKIEFSETEILKRYEEKLQQEIKRRQLVDNATVREELKKLTQIWKPFDEKADAKHTRYRYSGAELYADAISVLLTEPTLLQKEAPTFYNAYFGYMDAHPSMKEAYMDLMSKGKDGIMADRKAKVRGMADKEVERREALKKKGRKGFKGVVKSAVSKIKQFAVDRYSPIYDELKSIEKKQGKIAELEDPRHDIENYGHQLSEMSFYVEQFGDIKKRLEKDGLEWKDLHEILFEERIIEERDEIANPLNFTPEVAAEQREQLKKDLGDDKYAKLQQHVKEFRKSRNYIIEKMEESGMYDPKLMKHMKNNESYVAFAVQKYMDGNFGVNGNNVSGKIFKQQGTYEDVREVASATIMKDLSIIRAINRKKMLEKTVQTLQKYSPDLVRIADEKGKGNSRRILDPKEAGWGLVTYYNKGKMEGYYLPEDMVNAFNKNPGEMNAVYTLMAKMNMPFKEAYINKNPGFWVTNLMRDYSANTKKLPGMNVPFSHFWELLPRYVRAMKPDVRKKLLTEMKQQNLLITAEQYFSTDSETSEIENLTKRFGVDDGKKKNPLKRLADNMDALNEFFEQTSKLAAKLYLDEKTDWSDLKKAHAIRTQAGSPDFTRKGTGHPLLNNTFIFYNAIKEGWRAEVEVAKERPAEYTWKTAKALMPKVLMYLAGAGYFGKEEEELINNESEYNLKNKIVIPLFWVGEGENRKAVTLKLPQNETDRVVGALFSEMMPSDKGDEKDLVGVLDYLGGQMPGIAPAFSMAGDVKSFATGKNPHNEFYGRGAIPDEVWNAKGNNKEKTEHALKYLWNQYGGGSIHRFDTDDIKEDKGAVESVVKAPILSNVLGRFISVTDAGNRQRLRSLRLEAEREKNGERRAMKRAIAHHMNSRDSGELDLEDATELYKELLYEKIVKPEYKFKSFYKQYQKMQNDKGGRNIINEVLKFRSRKEQLKAIDTLLENEGLSRDSKEWKERRLEIMKKVKGRS